MKKSEYYCRMCEEKIYSKTMDGLCEMCHISLCQKTPDKCARCQNIHDGIINLLKTIEDTLEEEKDEESK